jgi:hypothetical protein
VATDWKEWRRTILHAKFTTDFSVQGGEGDIKVFKHSLSLFSLSCDFLFQKNIRTSPVTHLIHTKGSFTGIMTTVSNLYTAIQHVWGG